MKIEITYELTDFRCGQRFSTMGAKEQWILGYDPSTNKLALISLDDGMIALYFNDKQMLIDHLNDGDLLPVEVIQTFKDREFV